jgi:hypothetical protein
LTGYGFHSAFPDLADTDTGTNCGKACANCTACICPGNSAQQYK